MGVQGGGPACWAATRLGGRETKLVFEAGCNTKYSTRLSVTLHITHTYRHTHTHSGLRNGPTYVALALWLNGPPCKWSGVEWNPVEPVLEVTFTNSHSSWSSIVLYMLLSSNTIHGIFSVQSTCLTVVFHNLSPSLLWSISWPGILHFILHTFLHLIICLLFTTRAHTIATCFAVVPRLCHLILVSLSTLYLEFYLVASHHKSI